jgi:hypothetical protein
MRDFNAAVPPAAAVWAVAGVAAGTNSAVTASAIIEDATARVAFVDVISAPFSGAPSAALPLAL